MLHALQLPHLDAGIAAMPLPVPARIDFAAFRKEALTRLKRGLPADAVFRCRPEATVAEGPPAEAILETAHREDVELIVMGIQARGTFNRLLFGSTTRRVMNSARCPVLSIRTSEKAEPWLAWPETRQAR